MDKYTLRLSRYVFLINKDNLYLIYNSRTNNFHRINKELFDTLEFGNICIIEKNSPETFQKLKSLRIITSEQDDNDYVSLLELKHNTIAYSTGQLGITLAPTISCNLSCPYCFESEKPLGVISKNTCDDVIDFINSHRLCKKFSLNWFGGEPLLGIERIEYFLNRLSQRIKEKTSIPMYYHSMITNATLLKGKAIEVFKKYPLDSIQITFDGVKERHNKIKFYASKEGTYDDIVVNIENFIKNCPKTSVALRINIDNNNSKDYLVLYKIFHERFPKSNIQLYPGILQKCGECGDESFMTSSDIALFNKWLRDNGIDHEIYPTHHNKLCAAIGIGAYAIGPRGELYNCWEDMGREDAIVGSIYEKELKRPEMLANLMRYGNIFNYEKCRECSLLPICTGGCPKHRAKNKLNGEHNEICSIYADEGNAALKETLLNYFYSDKWKNKTSCHCR